MEKKVVLVPLDGSKFAESILPHLARFLAASRARLILLRVAKSPGHTIRGEDEEERENLPLMVAGATAYTQVRPSMPKVGPDTRSPEGSVYASQLEEQQRQAIVDSLTDLKKKLAKDRYEVTVEARLGDPGREILRFLGEQAVDLVAMTTHCRSGLSKLFLGNVAQHVVHHASVPILLVRPFGKPG